MIQAHTVRDGVVFSLSAAALRKPAFAVINRIQSRTPSEQIAATAVALVAMSEAVGLDPHDLVSRGRRMMSDVDGLFTAEIGAIKAYAAAEIGREVSV